MIVSEELLATIATDVRRDQRPVIEVTDRGADARRSPRPRRHTPPSCELVTATGKV
jgi:hypothetical protein